MNYASVSQLTYETASIFVINGVDNIFTAGIINIIVDS